MSLLAITFSPETANALTLSEAINTQPLWVRIWVYILMTTNLTALFFIVKKKAGKFAPRYEAILILVSFIVAAIMINIMFNQMGYSRLLGLPHLLFWTPVYLWLWTKRKDIKQSSPLFGHYLTAYFIINAISLALDLSDVIRYFIKI